MELPSGYAIVLAPKGYQPDRASPLCLLLHGATGRPEFILQRLAPVAERFNVILAAPKSAGTTWDGIIDELGVDVTATDSLLAAVFRRYNVDRKRVCVAGFSDGATYALSLGAINGRLFTHIIAFSPGFIIDGPTAGNPRIFITHGTSDPILPIGRTTRRIVPALKRAGYRVELHEFDGGHTMPRELVDSAFTWLTGRDK